MSQIEGWEKVRLPWFEKVEFCPAVVAPFEGIALWIPPRVSLAATARAIPVFGTVRLGQQRLNELRIKDSHPLRAVVVGAIVARANAPFVGNAVLQAPLFPVPPAEMITEHFSVDLAECVGLPRGPARLFVFASVGPFTAQPRAVEVVA